MTPVMLKSAALRSRVKHSTTEPLRSLVVVLVEVVVAAEVVLVVVVIEVLVEVVVVVFYSTLTNFSTKYLMMCKVYPDIGGIK